MVDLLQLYRTRRLKVSDMLIKLRHVNKLTLHLYNFFLTFQF